MINVICVKHGDRYDHTYVNRLHHMIKKYLTVPFKFYCYTDNPDKVDANIIPMPDDGLELWWPKLRMFEKGLGGLTDKCLFFDLDVVIQDNIDFIVDFDTFHMIKAYWKFNKTTTYQPGMRQKEAYDMDCNSSCLLWTAGENEHIWNYFWDDPEMYMMKYVGIDRFMYHEGLTNKFFPEGIFYSRKHGIRKGDLPLIEPPFYFSADHKVCILNGFHKIDKQLFDQWQPYKDLEHYYE